MPRLDLILLPLLSGYLFLITFNPTRFYHQRIEKQRLIFNSLAAAFLIAVIGYFLDYFLLKSALLIDTRYKASAFVTELIGVEIPGLKHTIFFFAISYPLGIFLNLFFWRKFSFAYTVEKWGNQLDRLFWFSLNEKKDENKLLMLTTKSNKVYIGYVHRISEPIGETHITIIPNFSGFRNKENLKLEITTQYTKLIEKLLEAGRTKDIENLGIIIPVSEILIISKFNLEVFSSFNDVKSETEEQPEENNPLRDTLLAISSNIIRKVFK